MFSTLRHFSIKALAITFNSSCRLTPNVLGLKTFPSKLVLSPREISAYKLLFEKFDSNRDGFLTKEDLRTGLRDHINHEATENELDETMETMDSDKDGRVGLQEFLDYVAWSKQIRTEDAIKYAFQTFDSDNNGLINKAELKEALISLGYLPNDKVINNIMLSSSKSNDEHLTLDEFRKLFHTSIDPSESK